MPDAVPTPASTSSTDEPLHAIPRRPHPTSPPRLRDLVSVDDVVRALESAGAPQSARQLRGALNVPSRCLSSEVTALLRRAIRTGRVGRTGQAFGTRYELKG